MFFGETALHVDRMDFYNTRDTYILCNGDASLWCNRVNGNLQLRQGLKFINKPTTSHICNILNFLLSSFSVKARTSTIDVLSRYKQIKAAACYICNMYV